MYPQGSSPRVWGQGQRSIVSRDLPGIIPTRVGTRTNVTHCKYNKRDHPHACGDKYYKQDKYIYYSRIIPTRVGTSGVFVHYDGAEQDHPHACGDKIVQF
mgnify:CR=1 FL=1